MARKPTSTGKRSTRTLDRNRDAKRGATGIDRRQRQQGITLDERGQEQPSGRRRARGRSGTRTVPRI